MTLHKTDEALGFLPLPGDAGKPITVVGTDAIRDNFDEMCLQQALNSRMAPGVTDVILNPDGHAGYGAPVGCVMVSPTHIYPGPVGVDIKCSMSLLQLDIPEDAIADKVGQLGSYGGGNHFGECEITRVNDRPSMQATADSFGLKDGHVSFLSHCGSRGFGNLLAMAQFKDLERKFEKWSTPYPSGDKKLVYAPLGTPEADAYLDDMALGANFATVNHLLINALVLEAFQEILPGGKGRLVYFISHNIAREEIIDGRKNWVHRKGATRAIPGGHFSLAGTPFAETGHPILLPGNPRDGSVVMVAKAGAERSAWSVNHGAGRQMGRKHAARTLDQKSVDADFDAHDILSNCRKYPIDEAPDAYKNFPEVLRSVESAGLAETVAKLQARFVIKDEAAADD